MSQPHPAFRRPRDLAVDVTQVIEQESAEYQRMIAQLVRNNSILSIALQDRENEIAELQAKVTALGGGSAGFGSMSGPFSPVPVGGGATLPPSGRASIPEPVFGDTDAAPGE